ncbi:MAG: hypothetical protein ACQEW9_05915 [Bacteroidota bacterium]
MKRRSFIKTLPVLAAAPMSLSVLPENSEKPKRHFIGIGDDACFVMVCNGEDLNFDSFTFICTERFEKCDIPVTYFNYDFLDINHSNLELMKFLAKSELPVASFSDEIISHLKQLKGELVIYGSVNLKEYHHGDRIYRTSIDLR